MDKEKRKKQVVKVEIVKDNTKSQWEKDSIAREKEMRTFGNIRINSKDVADSKGKIKIDLNSLIGKNKTVTLSIEVKMTEAREDYSDPKLMNYEFKIIKVDFGGGKKSPADTKERDLTSLMKPVKSMK